MTHRTDEEIQEQIALLERHRKDIEANYADYVQIARHMPTRSIWETRDMLDRWTRDITAIEKQLDVLYWMTGKFEHFPWR